jgi:hypothetical protein
LDCFVDVLRGERERQNKKWGEQNHPSFDPVLMDHESGCSVARLAEHYEIPGPARAKFMTEAAGEKGELTWMHILVEEVAELLEAGVEGNTDELRNELVQCAAVCAAWVECLDRKEKAFEVKKEG